MMDAGVPIKRPVAGIAMGLIKDGDNFAVLSDILGDEDHLGDMDFKVAGSAAGVTSLQMDIKITSITPEIMQIALDQAREGRIHILDEMGKALTSARDDLADSAPKITTLKISVDKIRDIIGPGGKIIREICEETGAKIDIEDDGTVKVAAVSGHPERPLLGGFEISLPNLNLALFMTVLLSKLLILVHLLISLERRMVLCIFLNCRMAALKNHRHLQGGRQC